MAMGTAGDPAAGTMGSLAEGPGPSVPFWSVSDLTIRFKC